MSQFSTPSPTTPPVMPGPINDGLADLPGWPKPVGIISIVWASLGLVCGACGLVGQLAQDAMMSMMSQQPASGGSGAPQIGPMPDVMKATPLEIATTGFGLLISGLLLVAGITLLQRTMLSRMLHVAYAGISVLATGFTIYLMLSKQAAITEWAKQNPGEFWAQAQNSGGAIGPMIGIVVSVFFGLAYPLFCIIWFGFIKTRPEQYGAGVVREQF